MIVWFLWITLIGDKGILDHTKVEGEVFKTQAECLELVIYIAPHIMELERPSFVKDVKLTCEQGTDL